MGRPQSRSGRGRAGRSAEQRPAVWQALRHRNGAAIGQGENANRQGDPTSTLPARRKTLSSPPAAEVLWKGSSSASSWLVIVRAPEGALDDGIRASQIERFVLTRDYVAHYRRSRESRFDRNFVVICQIHGDDRGAGIASNNFLPAFGKATRPAMDDQPRSSMTLGWHISPLDCDERLCATVTKNSRGISCQSTKPEKTSKLPCLG